MTRLALNAKHTTFAKSNYTCGTLHRRDRLSGQSSVGPKVDGVSELVYLRIEYMRKGRAKQVEHPTLLGVWTDRSQRPDGG